MALAELTDPAAVDRAMDEFDRLGRDEFLQKYGFRPARNYFVERNGVLYDSKPITGAAYGVQHPERGPLRPDAFSGGDATVRAKLENLGFEVRSGNPDPLQSFSEVMGRVLELQGSYSRTNTPEMQLRGRLIRQDGPRALQPLLSDPPPLSFNSDIEDRDGTGLKTRVPWIRVFDKQRSPSATTGWYVVYLFAADGSAVHLSLNQGTTTIKSGGFQCRPLEEIRQRVESARALIAVQGYDRLLREIALHDPGGLGDGYENGNVYAYRYDADHIPDDAGLQADLRIMLQLLDALYVDEDSGALPGGTAFSDVLRQVLDLQTSYSSDGSTPEMQLRGRLLKQEGPHALRPLVSGIAGLSFEPEIESGDGTSRKARVPWILIRDPQRYRQPPLRWYVAYLFAADSSAVYLSLTLSSPTSDDGRQLDLPASFRTACVSWARVLLQLNEDALPIEPKMLNDPGPIGPFFGQGSVVAYRYDRDSIPDDDSLQSDLKAMLEMLDVVYQNQHLAPRPPDAEETRAFAWETLLQDTLWSDEALAEIIETLRGTGRQIVLAGPPGTGKTHLARAIARYLTDDEAQRWRLVQFHPSYGYEEFVQGLRPQVEQGAVTFGVHPGIVTSMVEAMDKDDRLYVLVVDEMNRANLPRVFGELMYLLEYRDEPLDLQYSRNFRLPPNLLFIGTMNTADRSIRAIDVALRRRFEIFQCPPAVHILERYYEARGRNHVPDLFTGFAQLNEQLTEYLDKHHTIGHTFFMAPEFTPERLRHTWTRQIGPLIEEYFFDQSDVSESFTPERFWPGLP